VTTATMMIALQQSKYQECPLYCITVYKYCLRVNRIVVTMTRRKCGALLSAVSGVHKRALISPLMWIQLSLPELNDHLLMCSRSFR
jgi:hypothetical protein